MPVTESERKPRKKILRLREPFYLSLVICLPQLIFKTLLYRGNFRFLIMLGSFKILIEISIPLSSGNFQAIVVQYSFK